MGRGRLRDSNKLTPRELEILPLLAEGKTNKQICAELIIETSTLEQHLRHIYIKLHVTNRTQAAIAFINRNQYQDMSLHDQTRSFNQKDSGFPL